MQRLGEEKLLRECVVVGRTVVTVTLQTCVYWWLTNWACGWAQALESCCLEWACGGEGSVLRCSEILTHLVLDRVSVGLLVKGILSN